MRGLFYNKDDHYIGFKPLTEVQAKCDYFTIDRSEIKLAEHHAQAGIILGSMIFYFVGTGPFGERIFKEVA